MKLSHMIAAAARPQRRTTWLALGSAVIASLAGIGLLGLSGWFLTGAALAGLAGTTTALAFNYLLPSAAIRGFAIARTGARYAERYLGHKAALFTLAALRPRLFEQLAKSALPALLARRSGELASQFGQDVDALEDRIFRQVSQPAAWAAASAALLACLPLGLPALAVLAGGLLTMRLTSRSMAARLLPIPREQANSALGTLKADYADFAAHGADIAIYGLGEQITALLQDSARRHEEARMAIVRAETRISAVQSLLVIVTLAAMLWLGEASAPLMALGALAALAGLEVWAGLSFLDQRASWLMQATQRLEQLASAPPRIVIAPSAGERATIRLATTSHAVTLSPGQRLAIEGPSGAGKSRLIGTLVGLRDDAPELLAINDTDPRQLGIDHLRTLFALAPQDSGLIAGSVADNLHMARPHINEEEMWDALHVACADKMVRALPDGLDQWLGGDGMRLSGGQRRRIALARALLAGKPWLVLDEPSEGLDLATEQLLLERLESWLDRSGTGLILVSHRPALARLAPVRFMLD